MKINKCIEWPFLDLIISQIEEHKLQYLDKISLSELNKNVENKNKKST